VREGEGVKILLTGSEGFVGYHVDRLLVERGHEVRGMDITWHGRSPNPDSWMGDVRVLSSVCDAARGMDAIVHLAAKTGVADSMEWPGAYIDTNVEGTVNVFRAAMELGIKKVVYASSSSVYGSLEATERPMKEDWAGIGLKSIYAVTKFAQEHVAQVYSQMGVEAIGLRFFSVYGPKGRSDNVVARAIEAATNATKVLTLYGGGVQRRDFTYVGDVAEAVAKAVELDAQGWSGVMNVGGGCMTSVASVVEKVEWLTGREIRRESAPARDCDVQATWADVDLARRVLEWEPRVKLTEGIQKTIAAENLTPGA
jgi:UDP-glucuronate 4-epimerase